MKKLSIIIPVFNEIKTLESVIEKIESLDFGIEKEIIMVDDCSYDGSKELIKKISRGKNLKAAFHEKNSGKGAAVQTGLKLATGDYVIIQDADLEYDPNDYKILIKTMLGGDCDIVYGSRSLKKNPRSKNSYYYGGKMITLITNLLFKSNLTDVNTCYKLFKTEDLKSFGLEQEGFSFCEEATAKALKKGLKIKEVPISYSPRKFEDGKKIKWSDGIIAIITLLTYKIKQ